MKLHLVREMSKHAGSSTSGSTPKSIYSIPSPRDLIVLLRRRIFGQKLSLYSYGIDANVATSQGTEQLLKRAVTRLIVQWYGVKIIPFGREPAFVCNVGLTPLVSALAGSALGRSRDGMDDHLAKPV